ncbi:MAG TPA: glycoside hydrolase family 27 protein [Trebonia sp.]
MTPSEWPPSRPVMGYNTWYQFRTSITESEVVRQARLLVSSGLAEAGYNCVNLDDAWMAAERTAHGELAGDVRKFPHGIGWLAGQIHDLGLRFGIYTAIGARTCQSFPGSWGHYDQDARTFATWGVDFVKVDDCGGLPAGMTVDALTESFRQFGAYLRHYNPAVVYSQELPIHQIGKPSFLAAVRSSAEFAHMWRVAHDEYPLTHENASPMILGHLAAALPLHPFAGPGHWNDLDMVAPGFPASGWTLADLRNQLSVWAMEASPLLISADIGALPPAALAALKNPHMIAIDQSGEQCSTVIMNGQIEALMKPDPHGGIAVLFVNLGPGTGTGGFSLPELGIASGSATAHNVWTGSTTTLGAVSVTLEEGETTLVQITGA